MVSYTFDILDPGPTSFLNNTFGAGCGGSHNFLDLLT